MTDDATAWAREWHEVGCAYITRCGTSACSCLNHTCVCEPVALAERCYAAGLNARHNEIVDAVMMASVSTRTAYTAAHAAGVSEERARWEPLVHLYEDYLGFLNAANEGPITLAYVHGWRCPESDHQRGVEYRAKIAALRDGPTA